MCGSFTLKHLPIRTSGQLWLHFMNRSQILASYQWLPLKIESSTQLFALAYVEQEVDQSVALLVPLGIIPSYQRRGLGASLIQAELETLEASGTRQVFVLGNPAYYGRFGFRTESAIRPLYALLEEGESAWQSI